MNKTIYSFFYYKNSINVFKHLPIKQINIINLLLLGFGTTYSHIIFTHKPSWITAIAAFTASAELKEAVKGKQSLASQKQEPAKTGNSCQTVKDTHGKCSTDRGDICKELQ